MTGAVRFSSADFKPVYNKKDDGLLTGKLIGSGKETMSVKTSGSISTLAKPEASGIFLKGAFGLETVGEQDESTKKYAHTFTLAGTGKATTCRHSPLSSTRRPAYFYTPGLSSTASPCRPLPKTI